MIKVYCAYCRKLVRKKEFPRDDVRYGVCPACAKRSREQVTIEEIIDTDKAVRIPDIRSV